MKLPLRVRALNVFRQVWMVRPLESWLAAQTAGRSPDALICKFVPNPYQYPTGSLRLMEREHIRMTVDVSDYVGHYLYFGFRDPGTEQLFALCEEGSTIIDVGANIGWTCLRMAGKAIRGQVIAFEPDPVNASRCVGNAALNNFSNLKIETLALGDADGQASMEVRTPANLGGNRISAGSGTTPVTVKRMDHVASVQQLRRVDLIKIDVEGYELKVLKGAEETLKRCRPKLFIEIDDENLRDQGDSARAVITYLRSLGYTSFIDAATGAERHESENFSHCHFDMMVTL